MIQILTLLLVLMLSILVTKVATVALTYTGLSREAARFQARSALTNAGFTTSESERVVGHPLRRRIIMFLMLMGNAGLVGVVTTLMLSFIDTGERQAWLSGVVPEWMPVWMPRMTVLALGITVLWVLASSQWVDRRLSWLISKALKRYTRLDVRDYANLLHLSGQYSVKELAVEEEDWLSDRRLQELHLSNEGVLVLGIQRLDGSYLGAPRGQTMVRAGDTVILYGQSQTLMELDERRKGTAGNLRHVQAVARQQQELRKQTEEEKETEQRQPPVHFGRKPEDREEEP